MMETQTQIFVSYASEDKDFAKPLAEALRDKGFRVWFDDFELTMGDSLLGRIDEGLAKSDYGVVILSPDFFRKKWPRAELDGLFALETKTRKMILPVWKGINAAGVATHSPILGGRLAIPAEHGIDQIVAEIVRAIAVVDRRHQLDSTPSSLERLLSLDRELHREQVSEGLLRSEAGAQLVRAGFERLFEVINTINQRLISEGNGMRLIVKSEPNSSFGTVSTGRGIRLEARLAALYANSATSCILDARIVQFSRDYLLGDRSAEVTDLWREEFRPTFTANKELRWEAERELHSPDALADLLLSRLAEKLQQLRDD